MMRLSAVALAGALTIAIAGGCRSASTPPEDAEILTVDAGRDPAPRQYSSPAFAGRERIVIRDSAHMAQVWPRLTSTSMPSVDFTTETLVIASMGSRPTGGYSILVPRAWRHDGKIFVEVEESSPGPTCATTQAFMAPAVAAVVGGTGPVVEFVERAVVRHC